MARSPHTKDKGACMRIRSVSVTRYRRVSRESTYEEDGDGREDEEHRGLLAHRQRILDGRFPLTEIKKGDGLKGQPMAPTPLVRPPTLTIARTRSASVSS